MYSYEKNSTYKKEDRLDIQAVKLFSRYLDRFDLSKQSVIEHLQLADFDKKLTNIMKSDARQKALADYFIDREMNGDWPDMRKIPSDINLSLGRIAVAKHAKWLEKQSSSKNISQNEMAM